jgi:hypothetical protein
MGFESRIHARNDSGMSQSCRTHLVLPPSPHPLPCTAVMMLHAPVMHCMHMILILPPIVSVSSPVAISFENAYLEALDVFQCWVLGPKWKGPHCSHWETRRPVFERGVPLSLQILNGTPDGPFSSPSAILCRSYMKILSSTPIS